MVDHLFHLQYSDAGFRFTSIGERLGVSPPCSRASCYPVDRSFTPAPLDDATSPDTELHRSIKGTIQSGPLFLILDNILLDDFDKELKDRGLRRYFQGRVGQFSLVPMKTYFETLDNWVLSRIRFCYWMQCRRARTRIQNLLKLGIRKADAVPHGISSKGRP